MELEKTVRYWSDGAAYDLETGEALLQAGKYPYALFFGHLALEKLLKALVVKGTGSHAPLTHSLPALASKSGIAVPEAMMDQLAEITEFHIESRYPDDRREFYALCTEAFARAKNREIRDIYSWLTQKLTD